MCPDVWSPGWAGWQRAFVLRSKVSGSGCCGLRSAGLCADGIPVRNSWLHARILSGKREHGSDQRFADSGAACKCCGQYCGSLASYADGGGSGSDKTCPARCHGFRAWNRSRRADRAFVYGFLLPKEHRRKKSGNSFGRHRKRREIPDFPPGYGPCDYALYAQRRDHEPDNLTESDDLYADAD